jgi:phosphatidylinositol alpha-1,6-mannosyltransferase
VNLVSFDYPPFDGGIARLCGAIALEASRAGVDVRVFSQQGPAVGVDVPPVPVSRVPSRRPLREAALMARLAPYRAGLTVSGIWYPEGLAVAALRPGRHVVLAHGLELMPPPEPWRRRTWAELQRRVLEGADLVVANSRYTSGLVGRVAPNARVATVPLAVDQLRFSPGSVAEARQRWSFDDRRVVLTVSRLAGYKAHDAILRALALVPPGERQRLVYAIAGRGGYEATLRSLAQQLGVAEQVRWLGFVDDEALPSLYRAADLFALTTRESTERAEVEGFGLVFLEAQGCGIPALGANTGGIPDAIAEGDGGWLVAQDDVAAIARHLRDLVREPERYAAQGRLARARVEREFTWAHYWQRLSAALTGAGIAIE